MDDKERKGISRRGALKTIAGGLVWASVIGLGKGTSHGQQAKAGVSVMIVSTVCVLTCILAPAALVIAVGGMIYAVLAAVEANSGRYYRYPYTIRLIN